MIRRARRDGREARGNEEREKRKKNICHGVKQYARICNILKPLS